VLFSHNGMILIITHFTTVTEDELRRCFAPFGPVVEAVIMFDRNTGRPRGFGFVTFHDESVRTQLLQDLHPQQGRLSMRDRTIEVKPAQPKTYLYYSSAVAPHDQNLPHYYSAASPPRSTMMNDIHENNNYSEYYYSGLSPYPTPTAPLPQYQQHQYQQQPPPPQFYYYPPPPLPPHSPDTNTAARYYHPLQPLSPQQQQQQQQQQSYHHPYHPTSFAQRSPPAPTTTTTTTMFYPVSQ
jgi:RNA recognition motif-containing protein